MKWTVESMNVLPQYNGEQNVVVNVTWKLSHAEKLGEFDSHYNFSGMTVIEPEINDNFIPYENLTQDQVLDFVKQTIGADAVASYENHVLQMTKNMDKIMLPTKPLPWVV